MEEGQRGEERSGKSKRVLSEQVPALGWFEGGGLPRPCLRLEGMFFEGLVCVLGARPGSLPLACCCLKS